MFIYKFWTQSVSSSDSTEPRGNVFKESVSIHETRDVFDKETLKQPLLFSC